MTNTTEAKEVTMKELAEIFKGKYVTVSSRDSYGISIVMRRGTIEYSDDLGDELHLVFRDSENRVIGSVCIPEDSIDNIKEYDGTYTIIMSLYMSCIDIEKYETPEEI